MEKNVRSPFIKAETRSPFVKATNEVDKEKQKYILLYYIEEDGEEVASFEIIKGRKEMYEFIKGLIDSIYLHKSKVLTEHVPYKDALNVYDFMDYVSKKLGDTDFHIEDYKEEGVEEYEEE